MMNELNVNVNKMGSPKCRCGKEIGMHQVLCHECRREVIRIAEADRYAKAEKVTTWAGPVFSDEYPDNEGFAPNIDEMLDWWNDEEVAPPAYVWTCTSRPVVNLNYDDILERATEDAFDGFGIGDLKGAAELRAALKAFNEANSHFVNWDVDYKRALVLGPCGERVSSGKETR